MLCDFQDNFWQIDRWQACPGVLTQDAQALRFLHAFEAIQVGHIFSVLLLDLQGGVGG